MSRTSALESVQDAVAVDLSSADQTFVRSVRGIYVGVTGDVSVDMFNGTTILLKSLQAGIIHYINVKTIHKTNTTATNILAFF